MTKAPLPACVLSAALCWRLPVPLGQGKAVLPCRELEANTYTNILDLCAGSTPAPVRPSGTSCICVTSLDAFLSQPVVPPAVSSPGPSWAVATSPSIAWLQTALRAALALGTSPGPAGPHGGPRPLASSPCHVACLCGCHTGPCSVCPAPAFFLSLGSFVIWDPPPELILLSPSRLQHPKPLRARWFLDTLPSCSRFPCLLPACEDTVSLLPSLSSDFYPKMLVPLFKALFSLPRAGPGSARSSTLQRVSGLGGFHGRTGVIYWVAEAQPGSLGQGFRTVSRLVLRMFLTSSGKGTETCG